MISSLPLRASRAALGILLLAGLGCLSPFERLNPHDSEMEIELAIVGGKDSTRTLGDVLVFQLSSDPVLTGYAPAWSTDSPNNLYSYGNGAFYVGALPGSGSLVVEVRASFLGHVATRTVTLRPAL